MLFALLSRSFLHQQGSLIDANLTSVLVNVSNKVRPYVKPLPRPTNPEYPDGAIDYRSDKLLVVLDGLLNNVVGARGPANLNKIMNVFTNNTGMLVYKNNSAKPVVNGNVSNLANVSLAIKEANAGNLSSWTGFDVLEPTGPITLSSHTATQSIVLGASVELNISTLSKTFQAIPLSEQFKLELNLSKTVMDTVLDLALDREKVAALQINDIHQPGCILGAVDSWNMSYLAVNLSADDIVLSSVAGGSLEKDIDTALNNLFMLITNGFKDVVPAVLNAFVSEPLRKAVNVEVDRMLQHSNCTRPSTPDAADLPQQYTDIAFGIGGLYFIIVSLVVCTKMPKRGGGRGNGNGYARSAYLTNGGEGNASDTDSLGALLANTGGGDGYGDDEDDVLFRSNSMNRRPVGMQVALKRPTSAVYDTSDDDALLYPDLSGGGGGGGTLGSLNDGHGGGGGGMGMDADYWESADDYKELPLIMSPKIHWVIRYGVLAILCFNIAMMVSANTAKGAEVKAVMRINDDEVEFPAFFTFSLVNTVKDFWEAKARRNPPGTRESARGH